MLGVHQRKRRYFRVFTLLMQYKCELTVIAVGEHQPARSYGVTL
jgi:hypothetical protein